jgi:hypothetical protein
MRALVCLVLLAGCPKAHYVVVEVRSAGAPVEGATVSAVCKPLGSAADRSGEDGRVTLAVRDHADTCTITAAHPDLRAARREGVRVCASRSTCEPTTLELEAP